MHNNTPQPKKNTAAGKPVAAYTLRGMFKNIRNLGHGRTLDRWTWRSDTEYAKLTAKGQPVGDGLEALLIVLKNNAKSLAKATIYDNSKPAYENVLYEIIDDELCAWKNIPEELKPLFRHYELIP